MRRRLASLAFVLAAALSFTGVAAQEFPSRPIRMIVPVPPGGTGDLVARLVAAAASKDLNQPIVVDNRPGATGNIGTAAAVKAPADGYTVFLCSIGNCSVNSSLYKNPGFDLFREVGPVILMGSSINVLTVGLSAGINSVAELSKAGQISYASSGVGASNHLAGELLNRMAGTQLVHVPYKGSGPAITDLLGAHVAVFFDNEPSILPYIKSGKVKALAVTGRNRSANLPDLPTMEQLGYKGFVIEPWYGIAGPAGMPAPVVARLNTAFNNALADPAVRAALLAAGITPAGGTSAELARHIRLEHDKWGELIRAQKITAE
ncbi:MAG TPA: tripartite tricarboxylate transporter substrate binding protein [Ramlibacter sp.]|nr:tripartite tricarboxylate transporter substrate binding protein [Ramlibacter sp.]